MKEKTLYPSVIILTGPMGSGKTLLMELLAKKLRYKSMDGGQMRRKMAKEKGMTIEEFAKYAEKHPELEHQTDDRLTKLAMQGKIVIQSRVLPHFKEIQRLPSVYLLYLTASKKVRAERIAKREGLSKAQVMRNIALRDGSDVIRFKNAYGIDILKTKVYDLVVNNSQLTPKQTVNLVLSKLKAVSRS